MNIKVDNLNAGFHKDVEFCANLTLPQNKLSSVKIKGKITNSYGKYTFQGDVSAKVFSKCDSCLNDLNLYLDFPILEIFSKDDFNDDEIWHFSSKDNTISLEQPIIMNILLNLPMKTLCSENCKGLCYKCGQNLNEKKCDCDTSFVDPRFEEILKIFKNKEV